MTGKRSEQRQRTRQQLLDTALALFEARGIGATRTLDVAEAAGVSHGTVFAHFPTREALVEAALADFGQAFGEDFGERLPEGAGVGAALDAHLGAIAAREDLYARIAAEAALLPPGARGAWIGAQAVVSRRFAAAFQAAVADGGIRPATPAMHFNTWVGLLHHHLINRDLFAPTGSLVAQRGQALRDHFLALLRP